METIFNAALPLDSKALGRATEKLKDTYDFLTVFSIGKSVLGRNLPAYLLGRGFPGVLYVGGIHALEYITSMVLLEFTLQLCEAYHTRTCFFSSDPSRILREKTVCIIPMLNPDGIDIHLHGAFSAGPLYGIIQAISSGRYDNWQANANGVDLNHNFNAGFEILHEQERKNGITGPAPRQYGGKKPESEPETRAVCNLCRRMPFMRVYAFHSQGEEIYWRYGSRTPKRSYELAQRLASVSGYTVAHPTGMAAHGGFKDWFIQVFGRPGFTVEIGKGINPLPLSDLPDIYNKISKMLALSLRI